MSMSGIICSALVDLRGDPGQASRGTVVVLEIRVQINVHVFPVSAVSLGGFYGLAKQISPLASVSCITQAAA